MPFQEAVVHFFRPCKKISSFCNAETQLPVKKRSFLIVFTTGLGSLITTQNASYGQNKKNYI